MYVDENMSYATKSQKMRNQLGGGERQEESEKLNKRWEDWERRPAGTATLTCFTSAGMVQNPPLVPEKSKISRGHEWQLFPPLGKVLLSLLSSSRLLTFSFSIHVEFFPSVSAGTAAQTQAAILCSAVPSQTKLATIIQEVCRRAFQNKSACITDAGKRAI